MYIRSLGESRMVVSAAANLAGMYPDYEPKNFNSNFTWKPIPIHTQPIEQDPVQDYSSYITYCMSYFGFCFRCCT